MTVLPAQYRPDVSHKIQGCLPFGRLAIHLCALHRLFNMIDPQQVAEMLGSPVKPTATATSAPGPIPTVIRMFTSSPRAVLCVSRVS